MPAYSTINTPVQQGVPGLPAYLLGSFDYTAATGNFAITAAARTGTTCTLTILVKEGNVPVVGQLIDVLCSNATFNVEQAALTAVSVDATTGAGTIRYTGTTFGEVVTVAATGQVKAFVPEVGEALAAITSGALSIQENVGPDNGREVTFEVTLTGTSPAATVTPQYAMNNISSQFVPVSTAATTALTFTGTGGTKSFVAVDLNCRFVRFVVSGTSGSGSPTIVAKVLV